MFNFPSEGQIKSGCCKVYRQGVEFTVCFLSLSPIKSFSAYVKFYLQRAPSDPCLAPLIASVPGSWCGVWSILPPRWGVTASHPTPCANEFKMGYPRVSLRFTTCKRGYLRGWNKFLSKLELNACGKFFSEMPRNKHRTLSFSAKFTRVCQTELWKSSLCEQSWNGIATYSFHIPPTLWSF